MAGRRLKWLVWVVVLLIQSRRALELKGNMLNVGIRHLGLAELV